MVRERKGIDLSACEESEFDEAPEGDARFFPLEGGSVRTSGWTTDVLSGEVIAASGFDEVSRGYWMGFLSRARYTSGRRADVLCRQGCTNGPAMLGERNAPGASQ